MIVNVPLMQSPCSLCDDAKEVLKHYRNEVYKSFCRYINSSSLVVVVVSLYVVH